MRSFAKATCQRGQRCRSSRAITSRHHAYRLGSYPEASAIWLVKCAVLWSDTTLTFATVRVRKAAFYHGATTPDLTYLSETNSLVICDLGLGQNMLVVRASTVHHERWAAPLHYRQLRVQCASCAGNRMQVDRIGFTAGTLQSLQCCTRHKSLGRDRRRHTWWPIRC